jgi:type 1 fimbria pilin
MRAESISKCWQPAVIALLLGASLIRPDDGVAASSLKLKGALVTAACSIKAGDEALTLELEPVSNNYLYLNTRTLGKPFRIHLEGCDTRIGDTVTTTFSGNESTKLPGLLALNGAADQGVAIGMETLTDKPLPLNVVSDKQVLSNGNTVIAFKAFIKAEPQAITNRSITAGNFTATSIFMLNYP